MNSGVNQAPMQQAAEATICSIDSNSDGQGSMVNTSHKPEGKVKAYVDFSDFNKNYEDYLKQTVQRQAEQSADKGDKIDDTNNDKQPVLDRSGSNSSQTTKDWVVLG